MQFLAPSTEFKVHGASAPTHTCMFARTRRGHSHDKRRCHHQPDRELDLCAQLSLIERPRYTSQLWRQLVKDQRTWLTKSLIEVIDGEYPRDLWQWFKGLDLMRAAHEPRT